MAYGTEERMWTLEEYIEKYEQLQAENKELQEKYQAYTTGKAKNYHDVWCNASRDKPMGCSECSCTIGKQIKKLQAENKRLREELIELSNQMMEKYEVWDSLEAATALSWHERIEKALIDN